MYDEYINLHITSAFVNKYIPPLFAFAYTCLSWTHLRLFVCSMGNLITIVKNEAYLSYLLYVESLTIIESTKSYKCFWNKLWEVEIVYCCAFYGFLITYFQFQMLELKIKFRRIDENLQKDFKITSERCLDVFYLSDFKCLNQILSYSSNRWKRVLTNLSLNFS